MKKLFLLLFVTALIVGSCEDRDDKLNAVNIRIKNDANFTFNKVRIGSSEEAYENVTPGDYSDYLAHETAFESDFVTIEADSANYSYQPKDSIGLDSLNFGFYTYRLSVSEEGEVTLSFKVD